MITKNIPMKPPSIGMDVAVGPYAVLGLMPMTNAANRRVVFKPGSGRIGARVIIGSHAVLYAGAVIGEDSRIGDHATIRENCRIGKRCVIGTKTDLQFDVILGDDVRVQAQTQLAGGTVVGEGSFIGPGVQTANDPHIAKFPLSEYRDRGQVAPVIGKHVFIGVGAIILPGVLIGDNAIIAAGALVAKDVPAGSMVVGVPARLHIDHDAVDAVLEEAALRKIGSRFAIGERI